MDAGSSFDVDLAVAQLPTVLTGAFCLVALKAITLGLATRVPRTLEPKRLPPADGLRLALLLSGGGEFAFVVLALAEKLKVNRSTQYYGLLAVLFPHDSLVVLILPTHMFLPLCCLGASRWVGRVANRDRLGHDGCDTFARRLG